MEQRPWCTPGLCHLEQGVCVWVFVCVCGSHFSMYPNTSKGCCEDQEEICIDCLEVLNTSYFLLLLSLLIGLFHFTDAETLGHSLV